MDKIKILVVDDHPMMREALQIAIAEEADMEVVGQAADGREALERMVELDPDVILMDLLMPVMDGLETIQRMIEESPQAKILALTSMEDEDKILAAVQAGALGYFPKTTSRRFLIEAIHKIADGIPYLPSSIALKLFKSLRKRKTFVAEPGQEPLSSRQREVLALLGQGFSDIEIAATLHIEESTVRAHVHNILQRLGLETRVQAVAYANRQ